MGGGRRFLSQDLNPGSDSAALRETKAGENLTESRVMGKGLSPLLPCRLHPSGQPEVQCPEETALEINFKIPS